jgi:hypothetical protein
VDTYSEDREEGARVGEQKTFLPLDPQTRFRYQSSSDGGSSPSVVERTPRRSSIFLVQRTTTRRTYQPGRTCSCCGLVFVDQSAEQITALR